MTEFLPMVWNESDEDDVKLLASFNQSFKINVLVKKRLLNKSIMDEIDKALNGAIPRNFVINIRGGIGRQTGIFKSSFACQFCLENDPTFSHTRVAFTTNQLNDLVREQGIRKQIFMLDEVVRDLKQSAELRLANIIDSCREKQLCFVIVGVPEKFFTFSDYYFERLGESDDKFLPKKTIYYSVYKLVDGRKFYRGFIRWNVTQLDEPNWASFWESYMVRKTQHESRVIEQNVTGYDFKKSCELLLGRYTLADFVKSLKSGNKSVDASKVKNIVYLTFPDITNDERQMIKSELTSILNEKLRQQNEEDFDDKENIGSAEEK